VAAVRYYLDEHIQEAVLRGLRARGVDVTSVMEEDQRGASDLEHIRFGLAHGRVIVSYDPDFLRLHAQGVDHAGLAFKEGGASIGELVRGLLLIWSVMSAEEMHGHVEFL
jgi:hypothetical protein